MVSILKGMATLFCVVFFGIGIFYLWRAMAVVEERSRIEALYQGIGVALNDYAKDNQGGFPPLDFSSGRLFFPCESLVPKYINSERYWEASRSKDNNEQSNALTETYNSVHTYYYYPGYVLLCDQEAESLSSELSLYNRKNVDEEGNLLVKPGKGNLGGKVIYRLGPRAVSHLTTTESESAEIKSRIPVLIARSTSKYWQNGRFLVLFLDNHVEAMKYPSKFPLSKATQSALQSLEEKLATELQGQENKWGTNRGQ